MNLGLIQECLMMEMIMLVWGFSYPKELLDLGSWKNSTKSELAYFGFLSAKAIRIRDGFPCAGVEKLDRIPLIRYD